MFCLAAFAYLWISEFVGSLNIVVTQLKGEFLCYNCNKPGHLARDCKEKPRNPLYVDTRGTKITDVSTRHSERFHPYARGSSDRSKYDEGQSRERRFERSPPRESRDPRDFREVRDPREREVRDPRGYSSYERPAERRYSPPPAERRPPPPEYYRGAVPMREYPPVQRGRSPERAPVRYGGAMPERRMPDPRMETYPPRTARGGSDYYMDRRLPAQAESYRRSPEPAYMPRPRSRSPPDHYREYRGAVPPSDVYPRGRSPERMARPIPQRGPEVRRGRSPERYPEPVENRRYSRSPPPVQGEYRGYQGNDRYRNERNDNDYGRGRRERRTPDRMRNDGESFGGNGKRPLTPESKPEDGRPQTP